MIKWGRRRKNQQLVSSPRPSLLSSWLLRLKKMGGGSNGKSNKAAAPIEAAVAPCCRSRSSHHHNSSSATTAQFYGGDEDFWSLSFRKEKIYGGYETDEDEEGDEKREVMSNFSEMVSGIRRMKELQRITTADAERVKAREIKTTATTPRRRRKKGIVTRIVEVRDEDGYVICPGGGEFSDCGDGRRKSVYVNRGSPKRRTKHSRSCRVRVVVSPRVGVARAEDVSCSSRVKKKKEKLGLERFAVVKCSSDPQRDFRESMVEMILEMKICGAQQLEDLLACYLALNADEYHHLIINVFRQIWFDLNCTLQP